MLRANQFNKVALAGVVVALIGAAYLIYAVSRASVAPAYLTIVAGRGQWETAVKTGDTCTSIEDAKVVNLREIAEGMKDIRADLKAYGTIVEDFTKETGPRHCFNHETYPLWSDLATLKNDFGWSFGSNGKDRNILTASGRALAQQFETSCGALPTLKAKGHNTANGLFAYPGGGDIPQDLTDALQNNIVSKCFSYGRVYDNEFPYEKNIKASMPANGLQKMHNIFGGKCNDSSLPCYNLTVTNDRRYDNPENLKTLMHPGSDQWAVLQFHLIVTGSRLTGEGLHWDCNNTDWQKHWTSSPELYCWEDLKDVLADIPSNVQIVDPATVASAWGRTILAPSVSSVSPNTGPPAGGQAVTIAGSNFKSIGSPVDSFLARKGFSIKFGGSYGTVTAVSATSITVTTPAGSGAVDVTVTNPDGQSTQLAGGYTYSGGSGGGTTLKPVLKGLMPRGGNLPALSDYPAADKIDNLIIQVDWSEIETSDGVFNWNAINSKISANGRACGFKLRIMAGIKAPSFVKKLYPAGKSFMNAPAGEEGNPDPIDCSTQGGIAVWNAWDEASGCVPYFWTEPVLNQYKQLMTAVAGQYEGNPKVREVVDSGCMTVYAETFFRSGGHSRERLSNAGLDFAADKACHEISLLHIDSVFPTTRISLAINPWNNMDTNGSSDWPAMKSFADWARGRLGQKLTLQNNGFGTVEGCPTYTGSNGGPPTFCYIKAAGQPNGYQTRTYARLTGMSTAEYDAATVPERCAAFKTGFFRTLENAVRTTASFVELPSIPVSASCPYSTLDQVELERYDGLLEANAINGGTTDLPPAAALTAPATGATVSGTATVRATATDDHSVTKVDFFDGTNLIGTATTRTSGTAQNGVWQVSWNTVGVANGTHSITAKAYDSATPIQSSTSIPIPVIVTNGGGGDNQKPTITITSPSVNVNIHNRTLVTVLATDNVGVSRVEFSVNGVSLGDMTAGVAGTYSFDWNTREITTDKKLKHRNGARNLTATAYDAAGNFSSSNVVTFINNGDVNGDRMVDMLDYGVMVNPANWEKGGGRNKGDLNGDGAVNAFDYSILLTHFDI